MANKTTHGYKYEQGDIVTILAYPKVGLVTQTSLTNNGKQQILEVKTRTKTVTVNSKNVDLLKPAAH